LHLIIVNPDLVEFKVEDSIKQKYRCRRKSTPCQMRTHKKHAQAVHGRACESVDKDDLDRLKLAAHTAALVEELTPALGLHTSTETE